MKPPRPAGLLLFMLWIAAGISGAVPAHAAQPEKPQVMILGTFHFGGSASDEISVTMGDVMTPERQAEIENVVERLARFRPTKVMVEMPATRQDDLDATYQAYLDGAHELTPNEYQQIGMRLARRLGHNRVFAVDHKQDMDFGRVMEAGQLAGQTELLAQFQAAMSEIERELETVQSPGNTILDALRFHNSDWASEGSVIYLQLALLGSSENPAGAEMVGEWYERNLKIYANIARAVGPGDRALVVFGSGHLAHLAEFFDQNPSYKRVSALEALGRPK